MLSGINEANLHRDDDEVFFCKLSSSKERSKTCSARTDSLAILRKNAFLQVFNGVRCGVVLGELKNLFGRWI